MKLYFLLYMEDTDAGSSNMMQWFSEEPDVEDAMKAAYSEAIQRLRFDKDGRGQHQKEQPAP